MKLCNPCYEIAKTAYPHKRLVSLDVMEKAKCDRCGKRRYVIDYVLRENEHDK